MGRQKNKEPSGAKVVHLRFDDNSLARDLFGSEDRHLKSLEKKLGVDIHVRGSDVSIQGAEYEVETGERILSKLYGLLKKGYPILGSDIEHAVKLLLRDHNANA